MNIGNFKKNRLILDKFVVFPFIEINNDFSSKFFISNDIKNIIRKVNGNKSLLEIFNDLNLNFKNITLLKSIRKLEILGLLEKI